MEYMSKATFSEVNQAGMKLARGSRGFSRAWAGKADSSGAVASNRWDGNRRGVTDGGTQAARQQGIVREGKGQEFRDVHGSGHASTPHGRPVPEAIIKGRQGACELVRGLGTRSSRLRAGVIWARVGARWAWWRGRL